MRSSSGSRSATHFEGAPMTHGRVLLAAGVGLALATAACHQDELFTPRSEEHTSELQSQSNLVCRLLLEKMKYATSRTTLPPGRHTLPSYPRFVAATTYCVA